MSLFRINTNVTALFAQRQLNKGNSKLAEAQERLSSGLRINSAADDAAGLAISQKIETQTRGLDQASQNAQDGISLIQTAEGGLSETQSSLQRMRELAVQSANDTLTEEDRDKLQSEVDDLAAEIQRISDDTEFNEKKLLTGGFEDNQFQVGANQGQTIELSIDDMGTEDGALDIADHTSTDQTIDSVGATTISAGTVSDITAADDGTYSITRDNQNRLVIENSSGTKVAETVTSAGSPGAGKDEGVVFRGVNADSGANLGDDQIVFESAVTEGDFDISGGSIQASTIDTQELQNGEAQNELEAGVYSVQSAPATAGSFQLVDDQGNIVGTTLASVGNIQGQFFDPAVGSSKVVLDFSDQTGFSVTGGSAAVTGTGVFNGDETIQVGGPNISESTDKAANSLDTLDEAIKDVSEQRSDLGALQNRLETTINVDDITSENLKAARSRIRDADVASESVKQTRGNILVQAGTSVLAQANSNPQLALQLLGG